MANEEKICPLLNGIPCKEKKCRWWVKSHTTSKYNCSIVWIAENNIFEMEELEVDDG